MGESKEVKEPLDENENVGLKLNIQKTKIIASGPIISEQIDGEKLERVRDFILGGFKIIQVVTAALKFKKKKLASWKKSYEQPRQHIKKERHYFATKVNLVKAMVFPAVMYGCESWTIKKAEHQ